MEKFYRLLAFFARFRFRRDDVETKEKRGIWITLAEELPVVSLVILGDARAGVAIGDLVDADGRVYADVAFWNDEKKGVCFETAYKAIDARYWRKKIVRDFCDKLNAKKGMRVYAEGDVLRVVQTLGSFERFQRRGFDKAFVKEAFDSFARIVAELYEVLGAAVSYNDSKEWGTKAEVAETS